VDAYSDLILMRQNKGEFSQAQLILIWNLPGFFFRNGNHYRPTYEGEESWKRVV